MGTNKAVLCLGGNIRGPWGTPKQTLRCAIAALQQHGVVTTQLSHFYNTKAVGVLRQPAFVNVAAVVRIAVPPFQLLRICKGIEQQGGRSRGFRWGPRPLDIDIVDYGGRVISWCGAIGTFRGVRVPGRPCVPHPEAHRRLFVLAPLRDVMPHWRHPVFKKPLNIMISAVRIQRRGVSQHHNVDSTTRLCD